MHQSSERALIYIAFLFSSRGENDCGRRIQYWWLSCTAQCARQSKQHTSVLALRSQNNCSTNVRAHSIVFKYIATSYDVWSVQFEMHPLWWKAGTISTVSKTTTKRYWHDVWDTIHTVHWSNKPIKLTSRKETLWVEYIICVVVGRDKVGHEAVHILVQCVHTQRGRVVYWCALSYTEQQRIAQQ